MLMGTGQKRPKKASCLTISSALLGDQFVVLERSRIHPIAQNIFVVDFKLFSKESCSRF